MSTTPAGSELALRPAGELARLLRRRAVSSRELLEDYLQRIERLDGRIGAVVTLDAERARAAAAAADRATARGQAAPLHGVPMTIKDSFETKGMRTTSGAREYAGHVPASDAVAVARLRGAGAIVMGKTNLPPYTLDVQSSNDVFGTTSNPWDGSRTPGGSSGGAAAAVAAGLTGLELGSDIAGSIRIPAHFCGVYGLKPSHGLVPVRGHIPPPPGTLAELDLLVAGPLARSADDLDLALAVLAGPAPELATAWRLELPPPRRRTLRDYRMAAWLDDPACPVDDDVTALLRQVVDVLREEGVQVDESRQPVDLAETHALAQQLLQATLSHTKSEARFGQLQAIAEAPAADVDPERLAFARNVTQRARDRNLAHERRLQLMARWREFFRDHDVLLCPVTPTPAIAHAAPGGTPSLVVNGQPRPYWDQIVWPLLPGVAHLPVVVAPVGRTPAALPVGIQIVGPHLEDRTPIDVARHLATVLGGFVAPPGW